MREREERKKRRTFVIEGAVIEGPPQLAGVSVGREDVGPSGWRDPCAGALTTGESSLTIARKKSPSLLSQPRGNYLRYNFGPV
jgi:hypothetical protein